MLVLSLTACTMTTISPIEQVQKSIGKEGELEPKQSVKSARVEKQDRVKLPVVREYVCQQQKIVRVQPLSKKKNSPITVSFEQMSYQLSPKVSSKGKKYSNIRWIWLERFNGQAILSDSSNQPLAVGCIRK
ncbi:hypothetical protein A6B43_03380 [Vespertiliibacter pulmonis]|nr:hypothetical protein A6B43_03380 [Vespertiliibacter pulmonis]